MTQTLKKQPKAHAGLIVIINLAAEKLKPPPKLSVSEWSVKFRRLSSGTSAEPGQYRLSRAFFQKGWMDAVSDPTVEMVVVMCSSQVGKTESLINNSVGYFISQDPSPILVVNPILDMARAWSKDRFAPMLHDTPVLNGLVKEARSKDSENTILHKTFPGGHITMAGANSPSSLASRPIRILLLDEVDRFPESAGAEGDPVDLAGKRTTTFWNKKIIMTSTPTIKGASRIESAYEETDQRKYYVPCPHCDEFQILKLSNLKWWKETKDRGRVLEPRPNEKYTHLPETAFYVCEVCDGEIKETDRPRMTIRGEWRATKPFRGFAGFWINELYSPWVPWATFIKNFLKAKKLPETLKVFTNTALAETWEEKGDSLDEEPLLNRRENYGSKIPKGVLVITLSVDVQDDRLELEFEGWGVDEENWGAGYYKIFGDPARNEVWDDLDNYIDRTFKNESGAEICVACTTIDSGGHHTQMVYDYCKKKQKAGQRVYPIKGSSERGKPLLSKLTKAGKQQVRLFILGVDTGKALVYGRLAIEHPGPGFCHFPMEYEEPYFKGLTSEQCVTRFIKGVPTRKWVMKRGRSANEPLDLKVYNYAAMKILNPNFEVLAQKIEEQVAELSKPKKEETNQPNTTRQPAKRKKGWVNSW